MHIERYVSRWLAAVLIGLAAGGHAQTTVPDAGSLLRQIEQSEQQPRLPRARAPLPAPAPAVEPQGGMTLTVSRFRFAGNQLIADADLLDAVAPWQGRPVGFAELQKAANAVSARYREQGWLVRAYLPKQDIENGVVTIQVVEAVFGQTRIDAAEGLRLRPGQAPGIVAAAQQSGQPFRVDAVDRALLLLEDLPGLSVQGDLKEGQADGETDLLLRLAPLPTWGGDVALDNTGSRSTGSTRLSANLAAASPLGLGDLASANLIHTQGSDYARVAWSLPLGDRGWRTEINHSQLDYRVVSPEELARLDARGRSQTTGLGATYPLLRARTENVYLNLNQDFKRYFNASNGATVSDYRIAVGGATVTAQKFDQWAGGGSSSGSLGVVAGRVDLGGSPNEAADAAGPATAGSFTKLKFALSRYQVLTPDLSLSASANGQTASKNLDSSEKIYLGGMGGVRAYPSSEAGGSDGVLVNIEARYRLPQNLSLAAFFDWGQVQVNHHNDFAGAAARNVLQLKGAGLGLAWVGPMGTNVKLTWAHRIGSNPNPTATGQDQDGTLRKNRLWLSASVAF